MVFSGITGWILPLAALSALIYLLAFCWLGASVLKSAVKTLAVGLLAVAAIYAQAPLWLIAALALGSVGDFFLSREGDRAFLFGLVAFAAAHLAYVVLFLSHPVFDARLLIDPPRAVAAVVLGLFAAGMARLLWPRTGALRLPVMAYLVIICAMGLAALGLPLTQPAGIALIGAALFILSDAVLSLELFVLPATHAARRVTPFVIWSTYWLAQAVFLMAFALIGPA